LKCDADIIHEIPNLEVVTTSMLFTAQHTIYCQMEKDWFPPYCQTFTERPISVPENIIRPSTIQANMSKVENPLLVRGLHTLIFGEVVHSADRKVRNMTKWKSVIDWIITCNRFSKAMKEDEKYRTFRYFLQQQGRSAEDGSVIDQKGKKVSSTTLINSFKPPARKVVCDQMIVLCNLPNDLDFWTESVRFHDLFTENEKNPHHSKEKALRQKAEILVDCFLNSQILAKNCEAFINVPFEIRTNTADAVYSGVIDSSTFEEASSRIFPLMIHYWKLYKENYAINVYNRWNNVMNEAKEMKNKNRAQHTLRNKMLRLKVGETNSMLSSGDAPMSPRELDIKTRVLEKAKFTQFGQIGTGHDIGSKITYSVKDGAVMLIPTATPEKHFSRRKSNRGSIAIKKEATFLDNTTNSNTLSHLGSARSSMDEFTKFILEDKKKHKAAFDKAEKKIKSFIKQQAHDRKQMLKMFGKQV